MIKRKYVGFALFFSLLIYLILTISFEDRLYPNYLEKHGKSDFFGVYINILPISKCLSRVGVGSLKLDLQSNKVIIEGLTFFNNNCSNKQLKITITIKNMINYTITDNDFDFSYEEKFNSSIHKFTLISNISLMKNFTQYQFDFIGKVNDMFANYYDISSPRITRLFFDYSRNIFTGYLCGENCFNIIGGGEGLEREDPLYYTKKYESNKKYSIVSKEFFKVTSSRFLFTFNPKLRIYILLQKIIDALILGIVAMLSYEILRHYSKEKSQIYNQKQKLMQLSMGNLRQIVNFERLNVKDTKKERLVKKIIEARKK